ncbi:MAG: Gfo/Idh/MocA family oxidoreductase [Spirochaetes bacterium]|nr:Gfo/Idh/MocA family oxidoreductase [Spirochaetota bacterium]
MNRRGFLKNSAVTSAGLMVGAPIVKKSFAKNSPNETVNVAVVGIHNRGKGLYRTLCGIPNVNVATICDVDERLLPEAAADVEERIGKKPKTEFDFRKVLEDKDIDAVVIVTPDHWHALHTIWACQAGKDVYIEKPLSYTIEEGRKMVQAARKYNRVVQVGTQSRSSRVVHEAIKFVHEGNLGEIYMGRVSILGFRPNIGRVKDSPTPKGVHWDLFLGPAPYRPYNENRFQYKWHWFWDTSTTEFGNNGTHGIDRVRWAMNKREHPVKVQCMGDFYVWDSDQEIPNIQTATYKYEDGTILEMEVRNIYSNREGNNWQGGSFLYGSKGWMYLSHTEFFTYFGKDHKPGPSMTAEDITTPKDKKVVQEFKGLDGPHLSNFIDCVRSGRWQDLNADILEGHMSTTIMHLGNIAYRTGRTLTFNPRSEKFINDDDANSYLTKEYRHPYVLPDKI